MVYLPKDGQVTYGEAIGILILESYLPYIPGDVANATTFSYPVRFHRVKDLTVDRILKHDETLLSTIVENGKELAREGVRAITANCGFLALFQEQLVNLLKIPVFLSSLMQIPFIRGIIPTDGKVGVITSYAPALNEAVLRRVGVDDSAHVVITGLEKEKYFHKAVFGERGILDADNIEKEVVRAAERMVEHDEQVRAILLECSLLPPYSRAVQAAVNLPVFDFVTMIDYVHSAVVQREYKGHM